MDGGQTVLVVDDEPDARELLATCLEARGCDVRTASDGEEALEMLREGGEDVGLVITDVMMPRLDGLALCEQMRAEPQLRSIPVVLVSALFGRGQHDVAQHPVVGALGKPIDLDALLTMVRQTLGC
jgi:CheY-like chemotaxis protein